MVLFKSNHEFLNIKRIFMNNRNSKLALCIIAGLCSGSLLQAQQTFGAFKGRVTDKTTGAPKEGGLVTIETRLRPTLDQFIPIRMVRSDSR